MSTNQDIVQGQLFNAETRSQEVAILTYLKSGRSLTPIDALNMFKCFRLGARIYGLKKAGYQIETEMIQKGNKRFASYKLKAR